MLHDRADERLALSAANGDREAFGELLERHYGRIVRLGLRLMGDRASFRRLFKRRAGLTPAAYRRKFRGIATIGAV